MSKSPLSGAFADSSATTKKKNKKNGAVLLIAGIALTSSIGGVFAANSIAINNNADIQFGQGVAATDTCDEEINTSITQQLDGTTTSFVVRTVELTAIDDDACEDSNLIVSLLQSDNTPITSTTIRGNVTSATWTVFGVTTVSAGTVGRVSITSENY